MTANFWTDVVFLEWESLLEREFFIFWELLLLSWIYGLPFSFYSDCRSRLLVGFSSFVRIELWPQSVSFDVRSRVDFLVFLDSGRESPKVCRRRSSLYGTWSAGVHPPSTWTESSFMNSLYFVQIVFFLWRVYLLHAVIISRGRGIWDLDDVTLATHVVLDWNGIFSRVGLW